MQLLDGNLCAKKIREEISIKVRTLKEQGNRVPHLVAVLVGNDGASKNYVAFKARDCDEVGFQSTVTTLPETITETDLLKKIDGYCG